MKQEEKEDNYLYSYTVEIRSRGTDHVSEEKIAGHAEFGIHENEVFKIDNYSACFRIGETSMLICDMNIEEFSQEHPQWDIIVKFTGDYTEDVGICHFHNGKETSANLNDLYDMFEKYMINKRYVVYEVQDYPAGCVTPNGFPMHHLHILDFIDAESEKDAIEKLLTEAKQSENHTVLDFDINNIIAHQIIE